MKHILHIVEVVACEVEADTREAAELLVEAGTFTRTQRHVIEQEAMFAEDTFADFAEHVEDEHLRCGLIVAQHDRDADDAAITSDVLQHGGWGARAKGEPS